jgi:septal ring factor EnvC (AmiA/AmiB activator)
MSRAGLIYSLFLVGVVVALNGCNRAVTPQPSTSVERVRTLESRIARLEEDYRSAAATRDQARKQAAQLQEQKASLEQQLARITAEYEANRETLAQEQNLLRQRTSERDLLNSRCERMKKGLQSLLGADDSASTTQHGGPSGL